MTRDGLAALYGRLLPVYAALEAAAVRWADHPVAGRFVLPALHRTARLEADLVHLTGSASVDVTPASAAYADRVAHASAPQFVAHHYTRCLGDLSGGQVLRAAVERNLGLADGRGASFFAFPGLRAAEARRAYRAHLDAAPFTPPERDAVVAEALHAYALNVALAAELDADLDRWTSA